MQKRYVVDGQAFYYRNAQHPGAPIKDVVQVYYQFKNEEKAGLGMPMPAGMVRVYQADSKGGVQFVGEDRIDHTPKDETLNLKIGNAFDVVCERKQTDFQKIAGNVYEVEYEITLRNHKTLPVYGRGERADRRHVADAALVARVDEDRRVGGAVHGAGGGRRDGGAEVPRAGDLLRRERRRSYDVREDEASMISAREALERLREGNRRFVSDVRSRDTLTSQTRRNELAAGQEPFAIILGCSDSRVPAEIVFDQGLGDLFVIRVAGNIVASSQVGSVEFAAARFGTRLVVVLGHSQCGAVLATLEELQQPTDNQSRNLRSIVDRVRPSVEALLATELRHDPEALVRQAVRANIRVSANHLRHGSEVLEQLIQKDGLLVVGAEYSLETGVVDFFDGVPAS